MKIEDSVEIVENILREPGLERLLDNVYIYQDITLPNGKKAIYNTSLFYDFGGISWVVDLDLNDLRRNVIEKLKRIIQRLEAICEQGDEIFQQAIEEKIIQICIILNGLDFELEKTGYVSPYDKITAQKKIRRQEILERQLYGGKILQRKYESELCYSYLFNQFLTHREKLSKAESLGYIKFLKKIGSELQKRSYSLDFKDPYEYKITEHTSKRFFKNFTQVFLPRKTYYKIFSLILDICNLSHIKITETEANGFSISHTHLFIPKSEGYDFLNVSTLLRLIQHEILGHLINRRNHLYFFGRIRGKGSVMKEEGLAIVLELMLEGKNVYTPPIKLDGFARIFAGEVLHGNDFSEFIRIKKKLASIVDISSTDNSFHRHKTNYPLSFKGVQHKDVSYIRGFLKVQRFLKKGGSFQSLFSGKFSLEDIQDSKVNFSKEGDYMDMMPVCDIIIYCLGKNVSLKSIDTDVFSTFLTKKYGKNSGVSLPDYIMEEYYAQKIEKILKLIRDQQKLF